MQDLKDNREFVAYKKERKAEVRRADHKYIQDQYEKTRDESLWTESLMEKEKQECKERNKQLEHKVCDFEMRSRVRGARDRGDKHMLKASEGAFYDTHTEAPGPRLSRAGRPRHRSSIQSPDPREWPLALRFSVLRNMTPHCSFNGAEVF